MREMKTYEYNTAGESQPNIGIAQTHVRFEAAKSNQGVLKSQIFARAKLHNWKNDTNNKRRSIIPVQRSFGLRMENNSPFIFFAHQHYL